MVVVPLGKLILGRSQGSEEALSPAEEPPSPSPRTEADEAERLPADARGSRGHLADLLHALHPRALAQRLVQPRVPPVQVQHVAHGGVGRLLHGGRRDVADGDPCGGHAQITAPATAGSCLLTQGPIYGMGALPAALPTSSLQGYLLCAP